MRVHGPSRQRPPRSRGCSQVSDAFRRFDVDKSGKLDPKEFRYMCHGREALVSLHVVLGYLGLRQAPLRNSNDVTWVVVKIMVSFWVPNIIRHLIFRVPKKGP